MEERIIEDVIKELYEELNKLENCREKSIMLTKLDELRLWLIEYRYLGKEDKKGLEGEKQC